MKLLRPPIGYLRSPLPLAPAVREGERTERLRGDALIAMRRRVLARSGGRCECPECRASGMRKAIRWATFELDHVIRSADGGDNSLANFRAVHIDCHKRITARQNAEVRNFGCVLPERLLEAPGASDSEDMPC